jgi:hypothetical protein
VLLDGSAGRGDDELMSAKQQPGRWAGLPAGERQRRAAQSAADRARAGDGATPVAGARQRRRERQSRVDRELADVRDSVHFTIYGGDINMMDRDDW